MRAAPLWKRAIVPIINYPITCVQCVSNYGYRCNVALRLLPRNRYTVIYNGVDICRASVGLQTAVPHLQTPTSAEQQVSTMSRVTV